MGISIHVQECQRIAFEQKENQKLGNDPMWPDTPVGTPRSLRLSRRVRCVHTGHSGRETWSVARASNHGALRRSGLYSLDVDTMKEYAGKGYLAHKY